MTWKMSFLITWEAMLDIFTDTTDENLKTMKITFTLWVYR
jgi:hypothetical protein